MKDSRPEQPYVRRLRGYALLVFASVIVAVFPEGAIYWAWKVVERRRRGDCGICGVALGGGWHDDEWCDIVKRQLAECGPEHYANASLMSKTIKHSKDIRDRLPPPPKDQP